LSLTTLRIHGDNIIECERGLHLIANAFGAELKLTASPLYMPRYELICNGTVLFQVDLLVGYARWGINIQDIFQAHGAPLREATDVIVTRLLPHESQERILLAVEFSSALPAGNNAWQRNGRALACASIGVPYLYFTEIGGVELDTNRAIKAPRFPNPIVPFSYLTTSKMYGVLCLPVYLPSPSTSAKIYDQFQIAIGVDEVANIVKHILEDKLTANSYETLAQKATAMVKILSNARRSVDTLRSHEWTEFLNLDTGLQKANWLEQHALTWSKKRAEKVEVTETFAKLEQIFEQLKVSSIGASTIPICLLSANERLNFAKQLGLLYGNKIEVSFKEWLTSNSPLVIVWITGFKPRGDDSRPDRGLVPLARMLMGSDIDILTIVSGPAKPEIWQLLMENHAELATQNGLWESILNLSNALLVDSPTLTYCPLTLLLHQVRQQPLQKPIYFDATSTVANFSEHDVDTVIHLLFSDHSPEGVFEAMCNPPGGDWSGLSLLSFHTNEIFRWTSLPRVSSITRFYLFQSLTIIAYDKINLLNSYTPLLNQFIQTVRSNSWPSKVKGIIKIAIFVKPY